MIENQIDTYYGEHHSNMYNYISDNGNNSNVQNSNEFPIKFNEPLKEIYLPQPIHYLVVCC